eukprot:m.14793 g.14793  ORF g.14793 m.14793 type:complete len:176 (-) comp5206_c0_seq1:185-712(-)
MSNAPIPLDPGESILVTIPACDVNITNKTDNGTYFKAKDAVVHLSTHRLIFSELVSNTTATLHISLMTNTDFQQPWFGANAFTGLCDMPTRGSFEFTITFSKGGGDGFMMAWAHVQAQEATKRAPADPTIQHQIPTAPPESTGVAYKSDDNPHTIYAAESSQDKPTFQAYEKKNA